MLPHFYSDAVSSSGAGVTATDVNVHILRGSLELRE
jgi:hypothetical protein